MLTSPAEISRVGWCLCLTHKSPEAPTLQSVLSQPPCVPASALQVSMGVPWKAFLSCNRLPQWSSLPHISTPPPPNTCIRISPRSLGLSGCKAPSLPLPLQAQSPRFPTSPYSLALSSVGFCKNSIYLKGMGERQRAEEGENLLFIPRMT